MDIIMETFTGVSKLFTVNYSKLRGGREIYVLTNICAASTDDVAGAITDICAAFGIISDDAVIVYHNIYGGISELIVKNGAFVGFGDDLGVSDPVDAVAYVMMKRIFPHLFEKPASGKEGPATWAIIGGAKASDVLRTATGEKTPRLWLIDEWLGLKNYEGWKIYDNYEHSQTYKPGRGKTRQHLDIDNKIPGAGSYMYGYTVAAAQGASVREYTGRPGKNRSVIIMPWKCLKKALW